MAKTVTCHATKIKGNKEDFYKAPDNKWYQNQEVYENFLRDKAYRQHTKEMLLNLLDYNVGEPYPSLLNVKLKGFSYYSAETIDETIIECSQAIRWAFDHKRFDSTQHKIFYMFAILSNNIGDIDRKIKRRKGLNAKQINKRKASDMCQTIDINSIGTSVKGKDISSFLED